jgi:predicted phosphodiesterase
LTPKQSVCTDLLRKFPSAATLTLARMAYKDNPTMFTNIEDARTAFRRIRGVSGTGSTIKGFQRAARSPGDPFAKLPEGKQHFNSWSAFVIDSAHEVLCIADIHIPYHDPNALRIALTYGRKRSPDIILINGDAADFFSVSRWEKDPRQRDLAGEIKAVREFLEVLRSAFPKARIIFKKGNHEERWERYLSVKAPELLSVEEFAMEKVLHFDKHGVEPVGDCRPIRVGKLNVIHGHEYKFNISNPVNPARGFFMRAKVHVIGSHLHQSSQHSEKNIDQDVISTWSTGCLCDLHPDYAPLNNWNHGLAFISVDRAGAFHVDNLRIIDGKVY